MWSGEGRDQNLMTAYRRYLGIFTVSWILGRSAHSHSSDGRPAANSKPWTGKFLQRLHRVAKVAPELPLFVDQTAFTSAFCWFFSVVWSENRCQFAGQSQRDREKHQPSRKLLAKFSQWPHHQYFREKSDYRNGKQHCGKRNPKKQANQLNAQWIAISIFHRLICPRSGMCSVVKLWSRRCQLFRLAYDGEMLSCGGFLGQVCGTFSSFVVQSLPG